MKKLLYNLKSLNVVLLFIAVIAVSELKANGEAPANNSIELKYVGLFNNNPVVEVLFNGKKEDLYTIGFRDKDGVLFYSEKVKIAKGSKKFALNIDEVNLSSVTIEVRNKNSKTEEVFAIQNNKSVVEETVVVKVK